MSSSAPFVDARAAPLGKHFTCAPDRFLRGDRASLLASRRDLKVAASVRPLDYLLDGVEVAYGFMRPSIVRQVLQEEYDLKGSWVNRNANRPREGQKLTCRYCNQK